MVEPQGHCRRRREVIMPYVHKASSDHDRALESLAALLAKIMDNRRCVVSSIDRDAVCDFLRILGFDDTHLPNSLLMKIERGSR